jgi:hypothetical protein
MKRPTEEVCFVGCLMTSHLHMVISKSEDSLPDILRDFKKFTSREISQLVDSVHESRREWITKMFYESGADLRRISNYKVWRDGNHPILLTKPYFTRQKIDYINGHCGVSILIASAIEVDGTKASFRDSHGHASETPRHSHEHARYMGIAALTKSLKVIGPITPEIAKSLSFKPALVLVRAGQVTTKAITLFEPMSGSMQGVIGMSVRLSFTPTSSDLSKYSKFNFVLTVNSNVRDGVEFAPHNVPWGDLTPLYWGEHPSEMQQTNFNHNAIVDFTDAGADIWYTAEMSVVGYRGGIWEPIVHWNYGWNYLNGEMEFNAPAPAKYISDWHLDSITNKLKW